MAAYEEISVKDLGNQYDDEVESHAGKQSIGDLERRRRLLIAMDP